MHRVSCALCNHVPLDAPSCQSQVANQVKNLVPHVLVGKAQRAVFRSIFSQDNGVFRACAADQPHIPQPLLIRLVPERARGGDKLSVILRSQVDKRALEPDRRRKLDRILNAVP